MENKNNYVAAAVVLGICLIGAFWVLGLQQKQARQQNTISVTGSTKQRITSDRVKWSASFSRTVAINDLKSGYEQMKGDEQAVNEFLTKQGINPSQITISPVFVEEMNKYNYQAPQEYSLSQQVSVSSPDVQKVTQISKNLDDLVYKGLVFSSVGLDYTYTKLPELRVSMLEAAVKDAKDRAGKIAESTGKSLGSVTSAEQGVVQLLPPDSNDVADYGAYDSSTIEKDAMMTVRLNFSLK